MTRLFHYLALFAFAFFAATLLLGLWLGDVRHDAVAQRWKVIHMLSGLASALVVVLVNSMVVTYFIGTGRWCKEVGETYALDPTFARRGLSLKRQAFAWAIPNVLAVVFVAASGAAADPSNTLIRESELWRGPHLAVSLATAAMLAWSCFAQLGLLQSQHRLIGEVLAEVRRIRLARGLDTPPDQPSGAG